MTSSSGGGIGIRTAAGSDERNHGQLHVYDGDGKGKSQAALGVVLRTIGLGICEKKRTRVLLIRFLKGPGRAYAEDAAIEALQQGFPHLIDQVRTGRADYFNADEVTRFDRQEAQRGWDIARGALASALYSVVVLDELNPVLDLGLLDEQAVQRVGRGAVELLQLGTLGLLDLRQRPIDRGHRRELDRLIGEVQSAHDLGGIDARVQLHVGAAIRVWEEDHTPARGGPLGTARRPENDKARLTAPGPGGTKPQISEFSPLSITLTNPTAHTAACGPNRPPCGPPATRSATQWPGRTGAAAR